MSGPIGVFLASVVLLGILRCKSLDLIRKEVWLDCMSENVIRAMIAQLTLKPCAISFCISATYQSDMPKGLKAVLRSAVLSTVKSEMR